MASGVPYLYVYGYHVHACTTGVKCFVCLSACLPLFRVGIFKGSLYTYQVERKGCRWSVIAKNSLEAQKMLECCFKCA